MMESSPLCGLLRLEDNQQRCAHILPSPESQRWFVRQHRSGLEQSGALLLIAGRMWIRPDRFDQFVLEEGQRALQRRRAREQEAA